MFTNLFKSNSLDTYFSMFKKNIYLDTQVLLQVICWSFKNVDYDDSIDYQKRKYKSKDNCTYMPTNHRAFVNINYSDDIESVLTLAHEAGHMLSHNIKQKNRPIGRKTLNCRIMKHD